MPKIEFVSLVEGVADAYPIYEAKNFRTKWMKAALQEYKDKKTKGEMFNHIALCPGIFDLYNYGYIVPMWHEAMIETIDDSGHFRWTIPDGEALKIDGVEHVIGSHTDEIKNSLPKRPYSMPGVIKFNTPWRIIAPRDTKFLMIPINYPDEYMFEAATGILDIGISNEINVQVHWNVKGVGTVKAGTPMCQLIPLSNEKYDFVVRDATNHDKLWEKKRRYINGATFFPNRQKLKELFYKHFKC